MRLWLFNKTRALQHKPMFKKKKKRILIMLANSLKKSSNSNSTSARFLASLRRMNKAMVGLGWVASIATHNKKMTIWMITKVHLIGQTRLPSSFSNTGGVTLGTETKNTITSLHLIAMQLLKGQVNIKKLTRTKWMSNVSLETHSKLKKHLISTKCLTTHQISFSKNQGTDFVSKVSQALQV